MGTIHKHTVQIYNAFGKYSISFEVTHAGYWTMWLVSAPWETDGYENSVLWGWCSNKRWHHGSRLDPSWVSWAYGVIWIKLCPCLSRSQHACHCSCGSWGGGARRPAVSPLSCQSLALANQCCCVDPWDCVVPWRDCTWHVTCQCRVCDRSVVTVLICM